MHPAPVAYAFPHNSPVSVVSVTFPAAAGPQRAANMSAPGNALAGATLSMPDKASSRPSFGTPMSSVTAVPASQSHIKFPRY